MSRNTFIVSDTHWGHEKTCTVFKKPDGSPLRPYKDAEEMNEKMIENWNRVVKPTDKVIHLGDVVMARKFLPIHDRLNGDKDLCPGNHDIFDINDYLKYFRKVHGYYKINDLWLSHIPLHIDSIPKWASCNVHGHLHANIVMRKLEDGTQIPDSRYYNVSVECIDFTPIALEDLKVKIREYQAKYPVDRNYTNANVEAL